jgi:hypothetical protein
MEQSLVSHITRDDQRIKTLPQGINLLLIMIACLSLSPLFAQSTPLNPPMPDTLELPPGTIHAIIVIKSIQDHRATIEVTGVIAEGQGIVNKLSKGQVLTITIPEKGKISKGKKLEAFLKERMSVDASQSSYTLLRYKDG